MALKLEDGDSVVYSPGQCPRSIFQQQTSQNSLVRTMIQNMIKEGKFVSLEVTMELVQRAIQENGNDKFHKSNTFVKFNLVWLVDYGEYPSEPGEYCTLGQYKKTKFITELVAAALL